MIERLFGAIAGDISGQRYEFGKNRTKNPKRVDLYLSDSTFTDDTIGTIATADALLRDIPFKDAYLKWFRKYNNRGCGGLFRKWLNSKNPQPYGSFGNGSAMRVSPVGYWADSLEDAYTFAEASAVCTHNHPEGIKGAKAIAGAIWMAKNGHTKEQIKEEILDKFYPDYSNQTLDDIRPDYEFDSTCQGSVPVAILAFLESKNYEDCIVKAISMGGDADTLAAIAGSVALAFYKKMSVRLAEFIRSKLPSEMLTVISDFDKVINEHLSGSNL